MMGERGVAVDPSTLNRWVLKYAPEFAKAFRRRQRPVGRRWRLEEPYVQIKGKWASLDRAVDKEGYTIDFLLTSNRDRDAAAAFLRKAIRNQLSPEKLTMTRVAATPRRASGTTRPTRPASLSGHASLSTISWNRIIAW